MGKLRKALAEPHPLIICDLLLGLIFELTFIPATNG